MTSSFRNRLGRVGVALGLVAAGWLLHATTGRLSTPAHAQSRGSRFTFQSIKVRNKPAAVFAADYNKVKQLGAQGYHLVQVQGPLVQANNMSVFYDIYYMERAS